MKTIILMLLIPLVAIAGQAPVLTGIDVLQRDEFTQLAGSKVGLITNHTGVAVDGQSSIQLLHDADNVDLTRIFSPEHSLSGKLDVENIGHSRETGTGIPVVSLYGEVRRPNAAMLAGIDTLVFDIQDIGTRFYTYISTMGHAMIAAADHGVGFVVLDRPNPINGISVSGPVLDEGLQSFVGFHTIAVRHGMTVGEIALLLKAELELNLDLRIIKMSGWHRDQFFDETNLSWINPSPNMRSLTAALLYPGIGLLETTNLSVGRGTDTPFEHIGAPWLDGSLLAENLTRLDLPGVSFDAVTFTPDASKFSDQECSGVRFTITDRTVFEPLTTGFAIAAELRREYRSIWNADAYLRLLGNAATHDALKSGLTAGEIIDLYTPGLEAFLERRAEFLLYD